MFKRPAAFHYGISFIKLLFAKLKKAKNTQNMMCKTSMAACLLQHASKTQYFVDDNIPKQLVNSPWHEIYRKKNGLEFILCDNHHTNRSTQQCFLDKAVIRSKNKHSNFNSYS